MTGRGRIAPVDLHWGPAQPSRPMDCERLWTDARPLALGGASVRAAPPLSQVVPLCAHGAKHGPSPWPKLKWITDLEAILRSSDAGWRSVLDQAEETGHRRMALLGIQLARDLLEVSLPAELEPAVSADPAVTDLVDTVRARLLHVAPRPLPLAERFGFDLKVRERARDRVTYALARTLTPSERDVASAPHARPSLRVPRRLGRLVLQYLLAPSRAISVLTSPTRSRR